MIKVRRATTPTIKITIDKDLSDYWYRITFAQDNFNKIVKDQNDCILSDDGKTISVNLNQNETLSFDTRSNVEVQLKCGIDDKVFATNIALIKVERILDEAVI